MSDPLFLLETRIGEREREREMERERETDVLIAPAAKTRTVAAGEVAEGRKEGTADACCNLQLGMHSRGTVRATLVTE